MLDVVMLFAHVLDGDGKEFTIVLSVVEHGSWGKGMDMDLDDVIIADKDQAVSVVGEESLEGFLDEWLLSILWLS